DTPDPATKAIIFGGGKILGGLYKTGAARSVTNAVRIGWGLSTVQSSALSLKYYRSRRLLNLTGTRDWTDKRYEYAPCASCLSPLFDTPANPTHEIVFYCHAGKSPGMSLNIPDNVSVRTNVDGSLNDALRFISSAEVVVSNSYHGVYWSLLMGKKTLCVPFSNKFDGYRLPPAYATPDNWLSKVSQAQAQPEMLEISRQATMSFKAKVDELLADAGCL
ncbi:MAG: polysaccharide pyruvyl transferase family protein, partial [Pseudomonadota bacterium]